MGGLKAFLVEVGESLTNLAGSAFVLEDLIDRESDGDDFHG